MTAINRDLAARVAELGIPLSADRPVLRNSSVIPLPSSWSCAYGASDDEPFCTDEGDEHVCPTIRVHRDDAEQFAALVARVHELEGERDRLAADLARRTEDVAFLERATLPELRRTIQHHEDGKKRWRDRAREAEAMVYELKRPAELKRRGEIQQSLRELAAQAREGRDYEGEASILQRLERVEAKWARADKEADR